jgi:hypothetical protein
MTIPKLLFVHLACSDTIWDFPVVPSQRVQRQVLRQYAAERLGVVRHVFAVRAAKNFWSAGDGASEE